MNVILDTTRFLIWSIVSMYVIKWLTNIKLPSLNGIILHTSCMYELYLTLTFFLTWTIQNKTTVFLTNTGCSYHICNFLYITVIITSVVLLALYSQQINRFSLSFMVLTVYYSIWLRILGRINMYVHLMVHSVPWKPCKLDTINAKHLICLKVVTQLYCHAEWSTR